jgi:hypothetical protein
MVGRAGLASAKGGAGRATVSGAAGGVATRLSVSCAMATRAVAASGTAKLVIRRSLCLRENFNHLMDKFCPRVATPALIYRKFTREKMKTMHDQKARMHNIPCTRMSSATPLELDTRWIGGCRCGRGCAGRWGGFRGCGGRRRGAGYHGRRCGVAKVGR